MANSINTGTTGSQKATTLTFRKLATNMKPQLSRHPGSGRLPRLSRNFISISCSAYCAGGAV